MSQENSDPESRSKQVHFHLDEENTDINATIINNNDNTSNENEGKDRFPVNNNNITLK